MQEIISKLNILQPKKFLNFYLVFFWVFLHLGLLPDDRKLTVEFFLWPVKQISSCEKNENLNSFDKLDFTWYLEFRVLSVTFLIVLELFHILNKGLR